jgi:hypothetical protein
MDIEHAARIKPHAVTAITRLMVVPTIQTAYSRLTPGNHTSGTAGAQQQGVRGWLVAVAIISP